MQRKNNGYYDVEIDCESLLVENGLVDDVFYLEDLKQRKMFLNTNISQASVEDIVRHIMQMNKEDIEIPVEDRQPIILYISSDGGEVDAGFELIDVIENSKTPVYTVNLGYQYSMAFLVGLAGHERFATKNAKFLIHDGSNFVFGTGAKVQDQMEFQKKVEARIRRYVLSKSKLSGKEYDEKLRVEWYLFADEAQEKGFTDYIIGEDCGLDAII